MSDNGTEDQNRRLPLRDAAAQAGLSIHVLRRHIREGALPATKNGGRYEVAVEDLDALPAKLRQLEEDRERASREELGRVAQKIVDEFPPLSDDQKKELGRLLGGVPVPRPPTIPSTTPVMPGEATAADKEKADLRAWAKQKAAEAPPLSDEQVDILAGIFRDALRNRK